MMRRAGERDKRERRVHGQGAQTAVHSPKTRVDECHVSKKNTREKERVIHYFTPMQHAENIKLYNKHLNINRLLLFFHCMLFTQMSQGETGNFTVFVTFGIHFFPEYKS